MKKATVLKIQEFANQEVRLDGWISKSRSSGALHFLTLRDGTGFIQATVIKNDVSPEVFEAAGRLTQETSVTLTGLVREEKRAPGGYEISVKELRIVGPSGNYPITPKEHGIDFLMEQRHLWLRSPRQQAILKIRHEIITAIRGYLDKEGFLLIDAPVLTPSACEGTTTLFETNYFEDKAYLTQSGQLYMEAAAMAFGRVYCFGPTFRAEKSKTRRHLTEFWMVEPEIAFCDLNESLGVQENLVSHIVQSCLKNRQKELKLLERNLEKLEKVSPPFPRLSYDEALEMLRKNGQTPTWGNDLGGTDETVLADHFEKPVFIHRFPMSCKAFYMKADPARPEVALCADLLAPEGYGEIIGGGQREENLELLEKRMDEHKMDKKAYEWYLDLRRYGSVPHGGFGMGVERVVSWICGLEHVREAIPFARTIYRLYP